MRITFLINHWPPDMNPTGELMSQLAEDLSARGHRITVLTSFPHYEGFRVPERYRRRFSARERWGDVDVVRVWTYARGDKSMLPRLLNYLAFNVLAAIRGSFISRPDIFFCPNGSFFTGVSGRFLSMVKRARYVYNVQDLYPEVPIRAGQLTNPLAIRILRWVERYMYRHAAKVTVVSPSFAEPVRAAGVAHTKIETIPNFVDCGFIQPLPRSNRFSRDNGLDDRFVVAYAGNMGHIYDFDSVLEAAISLHASHPEILFLLIGDGVERSRIKERVGRESIANVKLMDFQPRNEVPLVRASSDIQIVPYRPQAAWGSMASKVYEIMASSRPLLVSAESDSDLGRLIDDTRAGVLVPPGDPLAIVGAIRSLYADDDARREMAHRGRATAETRFSRSAVADLYERLFVGLASS